MSDDPLYLEAIRAHRMWQRTRWTVPVVVVLSVAVVISVLQTRSDNGAVTIMLLVGAAIAVVVGNYFGNVTCPRCAKAFYSGAPFHNGLIKKCFHCQLPNTATRNPDPEIDPAQTLEMRGRSK